MSEEIALYTIGETADRLKVSRRTVRRWIAEGKLPARRYGRQLRVAGTELAQFGEPPGFGRAASGEGNVVGSTAAGGAGTARGMGSAQAVTAAAAAGTARATGVPDTVTGADGSGTARATGVPDTVTATAASATAAQPDLSDLASASFGEEWDNSLDAAYDDWRSHYGLSEG